MKRQSYQNGCVSLDRRRSIWYFRWRENGRLRSRQLGTLNELHNKAAAKKRAAGIVLEINSEKASEQVVTVNALVQRYISEKMPARFSTRAAYEYNLNNWILPKWGELPITDVKPYSVELWLKSMPLAAKSRVHLRGLLRILWELAMLWEYVPTSRNPMELVKIPGASKREVEPRILTVDEFHLLLSRIDKEPHRTMVMLAMCLGLRFSELIALKWKDVEWDNLKLKIERAMVRGRVDDVKTRYSGKPAPLAPELAEALLAWRRASAFGAEEDWIWASPAMAGKRPLFYTQLLEVVKKCGIDGVGWHTFRHSYRSWLDETGAPIGVQQKLMRHSDIRTTMNVYGDAIPETARETHVKVVRMAIRAASA